MRRYLAAAMATAAVAIGIVVLYGCKPGAPPDPETPPDPDLSGPDFFEDITPTTGIDFTAAGTSSGQPSSSM